MKKRTLLPGTGPRVFDVLAPKRPAGLIMARVPDMRCSGKWPAALVLLSCLLASAGCQLLERREAPGSSSPKTAPAASESESEASADLSTAIQFLEAGRRREAKAVLVELAEAAPRSEVLSSLLRQVDAPAQQLLPGPYRQVEVGPGESLSLIAARELGDPLMFYALARLNAIDVPARIPVGTVLRVPASMTGENESRPAPTSGAQPEPETPVSDAEAAAEYLARDGHGRQARGMLTNILAEGGGRDSTRELLVRLSLEGAAQLSEQGDYSGAIEVLDNALTAVEAAKRRTILIEARDAIRSQSLREAALRQRKRGELIHAYQSALRSAGLAPEPNEAAALLGQIQTELVETLHNKALVAWRDRNVDLAIRTWESLLEEVPDFEPARVYLDRARRLRKRLDEP